MQRGINRYTSENDMVRDRFNRFFDQAFGGALSGQGEEVSSRNWLPAVDISETQDALTFYAELPGLGKDDVEITVENNVLTLRGERKFGKDVKEENFHRIERSYGAFARSFTLPNNVRTDACRASFTDGVLRIELPKQEEAKPRKIAIG